MSLPDGYRTGCVAVWSESAAAFSCAEEGVLIAKSTKLANAAHKNLIESLIDLNGLFIFLAPFSSYVPMRAVSAFIAWDILPLPTREFLSGGDSIGVGRKSLRNLILLKEVFNTMTHSNSAHATLQFD
jgi:hypothetical protein